MGPSAASGEIQAGDVAHFPRKVWGGVVDRKKSCTFPSIVSSLDPSPRPERTRPVLSGPGTRHRLPLPSYHPVSFRSPGSALGSPKKMPNLAALQPGPASGSALRPMSTQEDPMGRGW